MSTDSEAVRKSTLQYLNDLVYDAEDGWLAIHYRWPSGVECPYSARNVIDWYHVNDVRLGALNLDRIAKANDAGYEVHVGMGLRHQPVGAHWDSKAGVLTGFRRGRESDIALITALWMDVDMNPARGIRTVDDAVYRILSYPAPPGYIIVSGGGAYAIWPLRTPIYLTSAKVVAHVKQTLRGIAALAGADTAVAEVSRSLRLPGTINTKPDRGQLCTLLDHYSLPGARIRLDAFLDAFLLAAGSSSPTAPTRALPRRERQPGELPNIPRLHEYLATGAPRGERNRTLFWAACRLHDSGLSVTDAHRLLSPRAAADGLDEREIQACIRSAYKRAPDPYGDIRPEDRRQVIAHDRIIQAREKLRKFRGDTKK